MEKFLSESGKVSKETKKSKETKEIEIKTK
jgi:hypothetical protein